MPKAPPKPNAPQVTKTKLSLQLREILGAAYAFVQGRQFTETVSTVTLEVLMKDQIDDIKGTPKVPGRLNKIAEIDKIVTDTTKAVEEVKKVPPETFAAAVKDATQSESANVNTPEDPGEAEG
jgi:hypothetical protein